MAGESTRDLSPCDVLCKMEEINEIGRLVGETSKSYKPPVDFWNADKLPSDQLQIMPLFKDASNGRFIDVYAQFGDDALLKIAPRPPHPILSSR